MCIITTGSMYWLLSLSTLMVSSTHCSSSRMRTQTYNFEEKKITIIHDQDDVINEFAFKRSQFFLGVQVQDVDDKYKKKIEIDGHIDI
jgi:hypothetical protein